MADVNRQENTESKVNVPGAGEYRYGHRGIYFVESQGTIYSHVSTHQIAVLKVLASAPVPRKYLHKRLWPDRKTPLTNSERASLSRTVARLKAIKYVNAMDGVLALAYAGEHFLSEFVADYETQQRRYNETLKSQLQPPQSSQQQSSPQQQQQQQAEG